MKEKVIDILIVLFGILIIVMPFGIMWWYFST